MTSVFSAYTTFAATAMLVRTVISELQNVIPKHLQDKIMSKLEFLTANLSSTMCVVITETDGVSGNEVFEAARLYLTTIINPSVNHLKVSKTPRENALSVTADKEEMLLDNFKGILLQWKLTCVEYQKTSNDGDGYLTSETAERRSFELRFDKKFLEEVLNSYLPFVVERSKAIREGNKVIRLYTRSYGYSREDGGLWSSVKLDHPSTFDTLAMDPAAKEEVVEDLERFLRRREFYARVGKAWKRGYLLYGPPGTGKSSLIAAMANYLKFDIYDVELSSVRGNAELRSLLMSIKNRSIIVMEDIDCSIDLENRQDGGYNSKMQDQVKLSGLLNFVDGLWSSCGDEKIIVFTTNHKEKLDPALLRPGRMDMHIHMSYCSFPAFKILVSNYLQITSHPTFQEIEKLLVEVEATPAELAGELMKSEQIDTALVKVVQFLCNKRDGAAGAAEIGFGDEAVENVVAKKATATKRKVRRRKSRR